MTHSRPEAADLTLPFNTRRLRRYCTAPYFHYGLTILFMGGVFGDSLTLVCTQFLAMFWASRYEPTRSLVVVRGSH